MSSLSSNSCTGAWPGTTPTDATGACVPSLSCAPTGFPPAPASTSRATRRHARHCCERSRRSHRRPWTSCGDAVSTQTRSIESPAWRSSATSSAGWAIRKRSAKRWGMRAGTPSVTKRAACFDSTRKPHQMWRPAPSSPRAREGGGTCGRASARLQDPSRALRTYSAEAGRPANSFSKAATDGLI